MSRLAVAQLLVGVSLLGVACGGSEVTVEVTYDGNGHTAGAVPVDSARYESGDRVTVLDNTGGLEKDGFGFTGWNTLADGSGEDRAPGSTFTIGDSGVVLHARWAPAYTVSYDANGATAGSVPVDGQSYLPGDSVTVRDNEGGLEKPGYGLAGWNTAADGSGTHYAAGATLTMGGADVVLYAEWEPAFAVVYDGNGSTGGAVPVDGARYLEGALVTVLGNSGGLTRTGYAMDGWNTAADGSGTALQPGATFTMGAADVTLYAAWVGSPELRVYAAGTIPVWSGNTYDVASTRAGTVREVVFRIDNEGYAPLELTGTPAVAVSGIDADVFSIVAAPTTPVLSLDSTSFTLAFAPLGAGSFTAEIAIPNDDPQRGSYAFTVVGTGVTPEISVLQAGTEIADGGSYTFGGTVMTGESADVVFTIGNSGSTSLTVGGGNPVQIGGADAASFSVVAAPAATVAAGATTTLTVRFLPTSAGSKQATLTIPNDDLDEGPYNVTLAGTATDWHGVRTIDAGADVGESASLALVVPEVQPAPEDDALYVSYYDRTNTNLKLARSPDGGATWTTGNIVATTHDTGAYSALAAYPDAVMVAYHNATNGDLVFAKSTNGGDDWTALTVDNTATVVGWHATFGNSAPATYSSPSATVYIAYADVTNADVKLAKSTTGGGAWTTSTVASAGTLGRGISMVSFGAPVSLAHVESGTSDVLFATSPNGETFASGIAHDGASGLKDYTSLAAGGTDVFYLVYGSSNALAFTKTTNAGTSWSTPVNLDLGIGDIGGRSSMKASGPNIRVAYYTGLEIRLVSSSDGGATWTTPATVQADVDSCYGLSLGWYEGRTYVAFHDGAAGGGTLKLARSLDGGVTW